MARNVNFVEASEAAAESQSDILEGLSGEKLIGKSELRGLYGKNLRRFDEIVKSDSGGGLLGLLHGEVTAGKLEER